MNDENVKNVDKVYCVHCEKSFAYHGSNTTFTYHLQSKHPLQYQKLTLRRCTSNSSTSKQGNFTQFFKSSDSPVTVTLQRAIKVSLANWIAGSGINSR